MEKICQTCGDNGFSGGLIYCTECWDTAEHIYCLGLSCNDVSEDFSWMCDSCKSADKLLAKMIIYGDKPNEMSEFAGRGSSRFSDLALADASKIPVVGPIWRGAFNTIGSFNGCFKGMEAFMPKTSYSTVAKIVRSLEPSLLFHMKKRCEVWPKDFDDVGAAENNIELYIFPESSSSCDRSEIDYSNLVEYMIADDLAMTANLAGIQLIVFTSLEIAALEKHRIQGKYYLWGAFIERKSRETPSECHKPSVMRRRIGKGAKTVGCTKKPNIKSNQWTTCKKAISLASLLMSSDRIALRSECKRARTPRIKRGKVRNARINYAIWPRLRQAETCQVVEAINQEECVPQVAAKIKSPKTVTEQENASLLNNTIDISENMVTKEESDVDDQSIVQDVKLLAALLPYQCQELPKLQS